MGKFASRTPLCKLIVIVLLFPLLKFQTNEWAFCSVSVVLSTESFTPARQEPTLLPEACRFRPTYVFFDQFDEIHRFQLDPVRVTHLFVRQGPDEVTGSLIFLSISLWRIFRVFMRKYGSARRKSNLDSCSLSPLV